jgi:hypothetical protein
MEKWDNSKDILHPSSVPMVVQEILDGDSRAEEWSSGEERVLAAATLQRCSARFGLDGFCESAGHIVGAGGDHSLGRGTRCASLSRIVRCHRGSEAGFRLGFRL